VYEAVEAREIKFEASGRGSRFDSEAIVMAFELAIFSYSKHDELEGSDTASEATKFKIAWVGGPV